ncbi:MAG TPA: serine/threonine-protein kinase [Polyangiaceae bacterium]|nr:serine/threonine-protein kinase [Polyangiaceae bacterium]
MNTRQHFDEGQRIAGTKYRVVRLLGSGGMGSVYEVEHEELGKRFVLKTLLKELSSRDDLVQRLRNEWRALGRLEHPNIVRVSDAGVTEDQLPYFVMERLTGETLASRLATHRQLPLSEALSIGAAVLDALSVAHSIGVVHRDVKPPNIFITTQGVPKLLDFGIAKLLDASAEAITARGVAVGTPRYMSPEQAAGDLVDARADLYAVGLVLYEMISGRGPYSAADANELFLAHLTQTAPPLSQYVPGIPIEIDALIAALLAKAPSERPTSAKVAADAMRAVRSLLKSDSHTPIASTRTQTSADAIRPLASAHAQSLNAAPTEVTTQAVTKEGNVLARFDATTQNMEQGGAAPSYLPGPRGTQRISEPPPALSPGVTHTALSRASAPASPPEVSKGRSRGGRAQRALFITSALALSAMALLQTRHSTRDDPRAAATKSPDEVLVAPQPAAVAPAIRPARVAVAPAASSSAPSSSAPSATQLPPEHRPEVIAVRPRSKAQRVSSPPDAFTRPHAEAPRSTTPTTEPGALAPATRGNSLGLPPSGL